MRKWILLTLLLLFCLPASLAFAGGDTGSGDKATVDSFTQISQKTAREMMEMDDGDG